MARRRLTRLWMKTISDRSNRNFKFAENLRQCFWMIIALSSSWVHLGCCRWCVCGFRNKMLSTPALDKNKQEACSTVHTWRFDDSSTRHNGEEEASPNAWYRRNAHWIVKAEWLTVEDFFLVRKVLTMLCIMIMRALYRMNWLRNKMQRHHDCTRLALRFSFSNVRVVDGITVTALSPSQKEEQEGDCRCIWISKMRRLAIAILRRTKDYLQHIRETVTAENLVKSVETYLTWQSTTACIKSCW